MDRNQQLVGGQVGHLLHAGQRQPLAAVTVAGGLVCTGALLTDVAVAAHLISGQAIGLHCPIIQAGQEQGGCSVVPWAPAYAQPNAKATKIMAKYFILATAFKSFD